MKLSFLLLFILVSTISCRTKEEWKSRSIYQIITDRFARTSDTGPCQITKYCGGNYRGIINKLDYIKGMGFDAIWISPILENIAGSYHGYHITNFNKLNPYFGTEEDLIDLISACHEKDIWVMTDVIINNVGPVGMDYRRINPFNSSDYYHDKCDISDWNNQWIVENCRVVDLPDLKQENKFVSDTLCNIYKNLIQKYNIDGIRIATSNLVPKSFLDIFRNYPGVFQTGEVFDGDAKYVADYENHLDSVTNYPLMFSIRNGFDSHLLNLEDYWLNSRKEFQHPEYATIFIENHDVDRFLHLNVNINLYINAVVFIFLWEGIPIFYYGGEQYFVGGADPYNREPLWDHYDTSTELYQMLGKINEFRKKHKIWDLEIEQRFADKNFYAFTRGNILACFTNTKSIERNIVHHDFNVGDKLCNFFESSDCVTVSEDGINISMKEYPKVYVKQ